MACQQGLCSASFTASKKEMAFKRGLYGLYLSLLHCRRLSQVVYILAASFASLYVRNSKESPVAKYQTLYARTLQLQQ